MTEEIARFVVTVHAEPGLHLDEPIEMALRALTPQRVAKLIGLLLPCDLSHVVQVRVE